MTQFRKKPVVITAITFDQLVAHGIEQCKAEGRESNIVNGMPWSFSYAGHPVTHENDSCYLIPTPEGTMKMGRDDMLITGVKGEIYPCKRDIFEATYDAAPMLADGSAADPEKFGVVVIDALPVIEPGPDSLEREIQAKANRAPRVTPADVKAEIVGETFTLLPSGRVTVCELTLKNGFTVRGEPAVVFIENFDEGIGRKVARDNAEKEVWQLLGFRLRDEQADAAADLADVKLVPPHQQRVLDEKRELDERLSKLDAFILDNPLYLQLPTDEQDRLSRQSKAMAAYSGILDERIASF